MNEPWFDPSTFGGTLGGIIGIVGGGIYGPLVGFCAPKGKLKFSCGTDFVPSLLKHRQHCHGPSRVWVFRS